MHAGHTVIDLAPSFSINLSPSALRGILLFALAFLVGWRDPIPRRLLFIFVLLLGVDQFFANGEWIWAHQAEILHETGNIISRAIEILIICLKDIEMMIGH